MRIRVDVHVELVPGTSDKVLVYSCPMCSYVAQFLREVKSECRFGISVKNRIGPMTLYVILYIRTESPHISAPPISIYKFSSGQKGGALLRGVRYL